MQRPDNDERPAVRGPGAVEIAADQDERIERSVPLGTCAVACSPASCSHPSCLHDGPGYRVDLTDPRRTRPSDVLERRADARTSPTAAYFAGRARQRHVSLPIHHPAAAADVLAEALGSRRDALAWLDAGRVALGGGR